MASCLGLGVLLLLRSVVVVSVQTSLSKGKSCAGKHPTFDEFVLQHGRKYSSVDSATRRSLYEKSLQEVRKQNCRVDRKWGASVNKFSDWTAEELSMTFGQLNVGSDQHHHSQSKLDSHSASLIKTNRSKSARRTVDWRNLGGTKEVRHQGICGSCWAVNAVALVRTRAEIANGEDPGSLSIQQLVACVPNKHQCGGTGGCHGSTTEAGLKYIIQRGIMEEAQFPYEMSDDEVSCPDGARINQGNLDSAGTTSYGPLAHPDGGSNSIGLVDYKIFPPNKVSSLITALQDGPAGVSMGVPESFHTYKWGILDACSPSTVIKHAVLALGYGGDGEGEYWLMQNSWGKDWGEQGHFKLERRSEKFEESEACGTNDDPLQGTGCKYGPDKAPNKEKICGACGILSKIIVPVFKRK